MSVQQLNTLLELAEYARRDPSLVPNHKGVVDRYLRRRLDDNIEIIAAINQTSALIDIEREMVQECAAENVIIRNALSVYDTSQSENRQ